MSTKLRNIGVVAGLTVISRVLGLVRDQLSAAIFGTSALWSAFVTAFRLPNLFRRLLGEGSLTAALVPILQETLQHDGRPGAFRLMSQVASWLVLAAGSLVGLLILLVRQVHRVPGLEERWYVSADLAVLLFPYLVFVCLAAVFSAMLNVLQRYTEPALSPIWLNLAMIAALGFGGLQWGESPRERMMWLCSGVLAGGFLQMAVPAGVLVRLGWQPRLDLERSWGVRQIARLMAPGLWGTAIYQVNLLVVQLLAMSINDSAAGLLFYANRLMELPVGVFAIAVSTVVFPLIARHAASGDRPAMSADYRGGVRLILAINVPAAAGLLLMADPIIRVLFERGAFEAADTRAMAPLLGAFALGMPFFSVVSLMTRAFYSLKDMMTPVRIATWSFIINLAGSLLLMPTLGVLGLAIASTVAVTIQTIVLQRRLTTLAPELAFRPLAGDLGKVFAATAAMSAVVVAGWRFLQAYGRAGDWMAIGGLIPAAMLLYFVMLWMLRVRGVEQLRRLAAQPDGRHEN